MDTEKIPEMIDKLINKLAERFGTTGQTLWHILVQQCINQSYVWYYCGWLFAILSIFSFLAAAFALWVDDADFDFPLVFGSIFFVIFGLAAISLFAGAHLGFVNPQYYALVTVLQSIK